MKNWLHFSIFPPDPTSFYIRDWWTKAPGPIPAYHQFLWIKFYWNTLICLRIAKDCFYATMAELNCHDWDTGSVKPKTFPILPFTENLLNLCCRYIHTFCCSHRSVCTVYVPFSHLALYNKHISYVWKNEYEIVYVCIIISMNKFWSKTTDVYHLMASFTSCFMVPTGAK